MRAWLTLSSISLKDFEDQPEARNPGCSSVETSRMKCKSCHGGQGQPGASGVGASPSGTNEQNKKKRLEIGLGLDVVREKRVGGREGRVQGKREIQEEGKMENPPLKSSPIAAHPFAAAPTCTSARKPWSREFSHGKSWAQEGCVRLDQLTARRDQRMSVPSTT